MAIPTKDVCPLHMELREKLLSYREEKRFDPKEWSDTRCAQLLTYMRKCSLKTTVVSISGGVDSACVLSLLVKAQDIARRDPSHPFNPDNGGKIIALAQPIHSTPEIQNRAYELGESYGFIRGTVDVSHSASRLLLVIDQSDVFDTLTSRVEEQLGHLKPFAKSMFKSYMRTPTAFLLASHSGGAVIGTGNLDEDGYLYYYCKFGDGAVDIGLIWDLHKSQVFQVGASLGVPRSILEAPPSADLAPGQTDETELGVTYDMIELITGWWNHCEPEDRSRWLLSISSEARGQFERELDIVESIHRRGAHKADLNPKNMGSEWFLNNFKPTDR